LPAATFPPLLAAPLFALPEDLAFFFKPVAILVLAVLALPFFEAFFLVEALFYLADFLF
jgi:hypothetical protein